MDKRVSFDKTGGDSDRLKNMKLKLKVVKAAYEEECKYIDNCRRCPNNESPPPPPQKYQ